MDYITDIKATATTLYNLSCDMDFNDYADTRDNDLNDLENALYTLNENAKNPLNSDFYRTLAKCLELITEN